MNKILQKLSTKIEDGVASKFKDKLVEKINKHPEIYSVSLLVLACFFFLFWGIGYYPLIDVDETRYAVMARDLAYSLDWNALKLNGVPFLEKPPLYFWMLASTIKLFGGLSSFAARLPIAIVSSFLVFFTYGFGRKLISRKFGLISSLVLLTSIFFLMFSHIAILDMLLTVFVASALYCAFLSEFCEEKNKKYFWWYFYLFVGLGFLSKGILALAIPATIYFVYAFLTKQVKQIFKPVNIVPGIIILLLLILPWHIIMYYEYGYQFIKEYFLLHHFARFMNSVSIGRERPLLYFVPIFLLGFLPWTFIFFSFVIDGCKKLVSKYKSAQGKFIEKLCSLVAVTTKEQRIILFFSLYFVITFVLFSSSSTKLPTYILPVFPAAAVLTGLYWWESDEKRSNQKAISISTQILAAIFILAAIGASIAYYFLPYDIQSRIVNFKEVTINGLYLVSILLLLRINTKRALSIFAGYILVMAFVIALSVTKIFNFIYSTGQNEIVQYAIESNRPENLSQLVTFDFAVKPSAMIGYKNNIYFITDPDFVKLKQILNYKSGPTFVIVKNKNLLNDETYAPKLKNMKLELVNKGEKYSLYVQDINNEYREVGCLCIEFKKMSRKNKHK